MTRKRFSKLVRARMVKFFKNNNVKCRDGKIRKGGWDVYHSYQEKWDMLVGITSWAVEGRGE